MIFLIVFLIENAQGSLWEDHMFEEMQLVPKVRDCRGTFVQGREEVVLVLCHYVHCLHVITWWDFHRNGCLQK